MPKMTLGLALTCLFVLLGSVVAVYFFFIYPIMKHSYQHITKDVMPTFVASLIKKQKKATGPPAQTSSTTSTTNKAAPPRKYTATEWTAKPRATSTLTSSSLLGQTY